MQQVRAKHAFTHGPGWRTVLASSIGEKSLIFKSKATSAPPPAGTTAIYTCYLAGGRIMLNLPSSSKL